MQYYLEEAEIILKHFHIFDILSGDLKLEEDLNSLRKGCVLFKYAPMKTEHLVNWLSF